MGSFRDAAGLEYTAAEQQAVDKFTALVSGYLGFTRDVGDRLKDVLDVDPDMPMAVIVKGYFFLLFANGPMAVRAGKALKQVEEIAEKQPLNDREKGHLKALSCWCIGDHRGMTAAWEEILIHHPRDLLALRFAHFQHFYNGDSRQMRDSIARVLPSLDSYTRDYSFVQGMYCFALEEAGEYDRAEPFGRAAVEANPTDAWAVHAVAHVMEMQGRHRDGVAWVAGLSDSWGKAHNFRYHLHWHQALFHLEMQEFDTVLALYDQHICRDLEMDQYLDLCNAASLLWRLELYGVDVGKRWLAVAQIAAKHIEDHELIFVQLHCQMALLAAERGAEAERLASHLKAHGERKYLQAEAAATVGVPLVEAMAAQRRGDYDGVVERLWPIRYQLPLIGGSHAQRDLFEQILVWSAIRSKYHNLARNLLAERTAAKPNNAWGWKIYAAALNRAGDRTGAKRATGEAEKIITAYQD